MDKDERAIMNQELENISDDELLAFLDRREQAANKRREYAKEHPNEGAWQKQKARMEQDPEYAAKVREQRREQTRKQLQKQKERMKVDPEYAQKIRDTRNKYTRTRLERERAYIKLAKERGLLDK